MSRIKSSGTKPEILMRRIVCDLTDNPVRFNAKNLPGKPDIVIHRMKLAIFVDGCFWHGCPLHCRVPKAHRNFWRSKIVGNMVRDEEVTTKLNEMGWVVWRYWEHLLKDVELSRTRRNFRIRLRRLEHRTSVV